MGYVILAGSSKGILLTLNHLVLPDLPGDFPDPFCHIGQHAQLRGAVSLESKSPRLDISSPYQQLLDH